MDKDYHCELRINTSTDRFNYALHMSAAVATCAVVAYAAVSPLVSAFAIASVALYYRRDRKRLESALNENINAAKVPLVLGLDRLLLSMRKISQKAGLKTDSHFHVLSSTKLNQAATAFAYEMGHLSAGHITQAQRLAAVCGVAKSIGVLNFSVCCSDVLFNMTKGYPAIAASAGKVVCAAALFWGVKAVAQLTRASLARRQEFQADRISGELLGDPMPLKNALTRRKFLDDISTPVITHHNPLIQAFKDASKLVSDRTCIHPSLRRRCERLEKMAQRSQRPEGASLSG